MKSKTRRKQHKQKQREKRLRKQRNVRRNEPAREGEVGDAADDGSARRRMDPERVLRAARRSALLTGATNAAAVEARADRLEERDAAELAREALALGGEEAAQELVFQAFESDSLPRSCALAAKALEFDPLNCDALSLLAVGRHNDLDARVQALEHAVRCGAERLGDERLRGEERGRLGEFVEARPYLRARSRLFATLLRSERREQALEHGLDLVELDAADRQGVRWALLGLLLEADRLDEARRLRERFPDDESGTFAWGAVLEEFLRAGARNAAPVLARARRVQPHFEAALSDGATLPDDSDARETFVDLGKAWITHGAAFEWLQSGAPLSTRAERDALCASFAPPVATLLELGEPVLAPQWPDYLAPHGFALAHVPELLRMLDAREFDELDQDDPRIWSPIHAARVLGQLRAAEAIEPLIAFARRHPDDDYLGLEQIMEQIGLPAVDALVRWLRLPVLSEYEHMTPVEALERIALAHPGERARISSELAAVLLHFDQRAPQLNALLCDAIFALDATSHRVLVAQVLDSGHFDAEVIDDLEALEAWAGPPVGD